MRFRVEDISSFPFVMNRDNRRRRTPEEESTKSVAEKRQTQMNIEREDEEQQQSQHLPHHYAESTTDSTFSQDRTPSPKSSGTENSAGQHFQLNLAKTDFRFLVIARITTGSNSNHPVNQLNEVFESIRRTIRQADDGSPIHQVCNAIGLTYASSKHGVVNLRTQNRVYVYQSALAAVNSAIQDPQRRSLDSTLLAVWLFNVYEVSHNSHDLSTKWY